ESQQYEIVTREQSIDDLRNDCVFVTLNAREERVSAFNGAQKIGAEFIFHGTRSSPSVEIRNASQFAQGGGPAAALGKNRTGCGHWAPDLKHAKKAANVELDA